MRQIENKTKFWIIISYWIAAMLSLTLAGCGNQSKIEVSISGHGKTTLTGPVAEKYVKVMKDNAQTAQGRVNETFGSLQPLVPWLFIGLIFGGAWAFKTQSKWASLISISAGVGLAAIFFIGASVGWLITLVEYGFIAVVIGVIAWRAIVYQQERNNNSTALTMVSATAASIIDAAKADAAKAMDALKNNIKSP